MGKHIAKPVRAIEKGVQRLIKLREETDTGATNQGWSKQSLQLETKEGRKWELK